MGVTTGRNSGARTVLFNQYMSSHLYSIKFPVPDPHYAYVRTRHRNSGLTSVRWYDEQTLFAGDFAAKTVYRVKPFSSNPIEAGISTLDGEGRPTETDLMDLRDNTMALTNFYTGEVAFYTVGADVLQFERVILPPAQSARSSSNKFWHKFMQYSSSRNKNAGVEKGGRKIHGVVFIPGYANLLWVSYCDAGRKGIEIVTTDGSSVCSVPTTEQAQDVAFMRSGDETYAIQAARTNHITVNEPNETEMYVTMYVYRLPRDLNKKAPELLLTQRFLGHLDALKMFDGFVYGANQHDSCVDEFEYSPKVNEIKLRRRIGGFDMPHGLDIRSDGLMAVTNYGPGNELRLYQLG